MKTARRAPEKRLESSIIKALWKLGFRVTKTSQPRPSMITIGVPDLYASHGRYGVRLWIEVKAAHRKREAREGLSIEQLQWIRDERAAGGNAMVAYSVEDVLQELKRLGVPLIF